MDALSEDPVFTGVVAVALALTGTQRWALASVVLLVALLWRYWPRGNLRETERHGGELVAEVLAAHGVKFVFTLVGGHISPLLVASKNKGIRVVDVRHEVNAVFAADAVSRLSGVPGVAAVTAGPGVTNTITAVKNAQMAQSPLILIGGAAATVLKGRGALQDIDQQVLLRPLCKFVGTCKRVKDIPVVLRKAFAAAQSGVPGPVFVELPIDTLYSVQEVRSNMGLSARKRRKELDALPQPERDEWLARLYLPEEAAAKGQSAASYAASKAPEAPLFFRPEDRKAKGGKGGMPWFVRMYLNFQLRSIFCGAVDALVDGNAAAFAPLPVSVPEPRAKDVAAVLGMLKTAQRPVVLLGSQATLGGKAVAEALAAALKSLGVPCFLGGMARGLLGRNHPLHVRQNRRGALRQADVVILAGAVADFRLDYGRSLSRRSKIVAINRSGADLVMNSDLFWKPALAARADPGSFMRELAKAAANDSGVLVFDGWARELKAKEAAKEAANRETANAPAFGQPGLGRGKEQLVNPLKLCFELDDVLPEDSILVGDGGDFVATAAYTLRPRGPLCWLDPGAFGTLGVGAGFALGAKLVRPSAEVWLLWGDGSAGYSIAEYDTFVRHKTPVLSLIGNDACWTQIEREQIPILGSNVACPLAYCHYERIAAGYATTAGDRPALLIQNATDDAGAVLQDAQKRARGLNAVPVVVNAHIGSTSFREGSISV